MATASLPAQPVSAGRPSGGGDLAARLDALWQESPVPSRAFAGLIVLDPSSGATVFARNESFLFTPASNAKLYSTALALSRLGPDYRLTTLLQGERPIEADTGILRGDLIFRGAGDPSLSSRRFPYSKETEDSRDYPIPAIEALADRLAATGLRRVTGDVVGDDSAYLWEPYHEGWAQDDALYDYGAPVSALTINDNFVEITVTPASQPGALATVDVRPSLPYYDVLNRVLTVSGAAGRIDWERAPGQQVLLRGSIAAGARPWRGYIAIDDPALFAAHVLRDALQRRGIAVDGVAAASHRLAAEAAESDSRSEAAPVTLATHQSPTLAEILRATNKESVNLFAELLLCEVGRAATGTGSRQAGLKELDRFLAGIGINREAVFLADASGLARLSLVSPQATISLLLAMWNGPHRDAWIDSLPLGGLEGTLGRRFSDIPPNSAIRAKTGTLRGVSALSGYATSPSGRTLLFSAFVNNHPGPSRAAREFLDKIAVVIAEGSSDAPR